MSLIFTGFIILILNLFIKELVEFPTANAVMSIVSAMSENLPRVSQNYFLMKKHVRVFS